MVLFLEVRSGPRIGEKFRVTPGFRIGRREGELILDDGKVSGFHAQIELDNKGKAVLVDQGSANGLVFDQRKVRRVALLKGMTFRVGDTELGVIAVSDVEAEEMSPSTPWQERLLGLLAAEPAKSKPVKNGVRSFTPALRLEFVQGPQAQEELVLGYGPRVVGLDHLDISLTDLQAPENSFELRPGPGSATLRDLSGGQTKLNHKPAPPDASLREGDLISIGRTVIKVHYI